MIWTYLGCSRKGRPDTRSRAAPPPTAILLHPAPLLLGRAPPRASPYGWGPVTGDAPGGPCGLCAAATSASSATGVSSSGGQLQVHVMTSYRDLRCGHS